jgi:glycosyltransferase involved in cell wall biosynthesis
MPEGNPLVSVTITNYNYARLVGRAIESVQRQTFADLEIVVVDNASTDDSVNVVRKYMHDDRRIRLIVNPENIGVARNHKRSSDEARGTFLLHLDADDWIIDPDALQSQVDMLNSDPDISFVFSPVVIAEREDQAMVIGRPFDQDTVVPGETAIRSIVMVGVTNSGLMMRMSAFRNFGGYNLDYKIIFDIKLAVDLCGQGKVGYINRPLYVSFHHSSGHSGVVAVAAIQAEMCEAIESAFTGPLAGRIADASKLRRRALNQAMLLYSTNQIFNDRYYEGWSVLLDSVRRRPRATLALKPLLSLTARTILGKAGWIQLARILGQEQSHASPINLPITPALE